MNRTQMSIACAGGIAAISLVSACSGSQGSTPSITDSATQSRSIADMARSGGLPRFGRFGDASISHHQVSQARGAADLFVSDADNDAVDVLANKTWKYLTGITTGIGGPDGSFVAKGKFYVANYIGVSVTEYSSPTELTYTYDAGMIDPIDVTVDSHGNVYEADYNYQGSLAGFVNEYRQGSNSVVATCSPGGGIEGVAVDKHGDVFADYNTSSAGPGAIVEYHRGLGKCKAKVLPITLSFAGGMAIDGAGNLLVCDQDNAAIDVIPPPYAKVSTTFGSGYTDPFHITINKKNTRAYVADYSTGEVYVLKYPSGTNVAKLGSGNGIGAAWAAVDRNNYVP